MIDSKYFKEKEFNNCVPSCSLQDMNQEFIDLLDRIRDEVGMPLVITSAYRSIEWDKAKGRSGNGDHPNRRGVDIRCNSSATRYKIVQAAIKLGVKRIGIANTFIHIGDAKSLPQNVIWTY